MNRTVLSGPKVSRIEGSLETCNAHFSAMTETQVFEGRRQKFLKGFSNQNNTTSYDDSMQYCACAIARIPWMLQVSGDNSKREWKGHMVP